MSATNPNIPVIQLETSNGIIYNIRCDNITFYTSIEDLKKHIKHIVCISADDQCIVQKHGTRLNEMNDDLPIGKCDNSGGVVYLSVLNARDPDAIATRAREKASNKKVVALWGDGREEREEIEKREIEERKERERRERQKEEERLTQVFLRRERDQKEADDASAEAWLKKHHLMQFAPGQEKDPSKI